MRTVVLNDSAPFTPLLIERAKGQTQLFVKEVKSDGKRYIVCRNETEAEKDKKDREAIVVALQDRLIFAQLNRCLRTLLHKPERQPPLAVLLYLLSSDVTRRHPLEAAGPRARGGQVICSSSRPLDTMPACARSLVRLPLWLAQ